MKKIKKVARKKEKKARKEEKKVRSLVIEAFAGRDKQNAKKLERSNKANQKTDNVLVESLTQSVLLNKVMMKRDKNQIKKWQESYYQELFGEFKNFIEKYNDALQIKAEKLSMSVGDLRIEKKNLLLEIEKLEKKKMVLANV
jgi:hypothetical protein